VLSAAVLFAALLLSTGQSDGGQFGARASGA
jgi:hypothetical protein